MRRSVVLALSYRARNPRQAFSEFGSTFQDASSADVDAAFQGAAEARHALTRSSSRSALLKAAASNIASLGDSLVDTVVEETGYTRERVTGERERTVDQLVRFSKLKPSWTAPRIDLYRSEGFRNDLRQMRVPLTGPVAVFGASNFPLAFSVAGGDTASAIAAGNPVVVKAHPAHPNTSELVAEAVWAAADEVGLPKSVLGMVHGQSPAVGAEVVQHPLCAAVGFTGSLTAGRALMDLAAARPVPIPVYAEMSSSNPVFVYPDALAAQYKAIAGQLAGAVTGGCGQFCTKPGVIVVSSEVPAGETSHASSFVSELTRAIKAVPPASMLTPGIVDAFHAGVEALANHPDVSVTTPDRAPASDRGEAAGVVATVSAASFLSNLELQEEVFGPVTLVVVCNDLPEMVSVAKSLDGQLTASLFGQAPVLAGCPVAEALQDRVGRLIFNGVPTGLQVSDAQMHGGPYPATSNSLYTSVGTAAIHRFSRPMVWQDAPDVCLPEELQDANPLNAWRMINGKMTQDPVPEDYSRPRAVV